MRNPTVNDKIKQSRCYSVNKTAALATLLAQLREGGGALRAKVKAFKMAQPATTMLALCLRMRRHERLWSPAGRVCISQLASRLTAGAASCLVGG